ncbi:Brix-domain-containing protein [Basidiobolus meristosporus CBS 931.73]|uniref:Brix-domain-containing protein n=1 Tax=Basidiobolus meristosporus CBS 931.73 TaxID=1314790 RepID=A0A1Y1ZCM0_9FUNG|nr:Brix-domain-containing protein [Basidiobolus meristosporus CBS 931.73]|eukprot:ORY07727.1 Brix-domain-containing protein [Basidiobolus meristosporus CBS 931.73]
MATVFKNAAKKNADKDSGADKPVVRNKQRVMMLTSRGITYRQRHLMTDLEALLPQAKKDTKLDSKSKLYILNELAELNNCNNCIYFESRKHQDLYLWISKTPNGPSAKFHVQNIHTMDELKMTGNCLKGSRHILSFDKNFDSEPHYGLLKEVFTQVFGVPKGTRKSKPFIDHVISFSIVDNRIWFRNYQIVEKDALDGTLKKEMSLVEIGPRFVLNPIRIFQGSFGGATLYENAQYISPNAVRASMRRQKATKYTTRTAAQKQREAKLSEAQLEEDPVDQVFA